MNNTETAKTLEFVRTNIEVMKMMEQVLSKKISESDTDTKTPEQRGEYIKAEESIKKVRAFANKNKGVANLVELRKAGIANPHYVTSVMVKKGLLERLDKGTKISNRGRPSITFKMVKQ